MAFKGTLQRTMLKALLLGSTTAALAACSATQAPAAVKKAESRRIQGLALADTTQILVIDASGLAFAAEPDADGAFDIAIDSEKPVSLFLVGAEVRVMRVAASADSGRTQTTLPDWQGAVTTGQLATCDCDTDGTDQEVTGEENVLAQIDSDEDGVVDTEDSDDDDDSIPDDSDSDVDGSGSDDSEEDLDGDDDGSPDRCDEDDDDDGIRDEDDEDESEDRDDDGVSDDEDEDDDNDGESDEDDRDDDGDGREDEGEDEGGEDESDEDDSEGGSEGSEDEDSDPSDEDGGSDPSEEDASGGESP